MNARMLVGALIVLAAIGSSYLIYKNLKPDYVSMFNLSSERMAKDLDGKTAPLPFGQVWPFDMTQNLSVTLVGKKQVEDLVVAVVEIRAVAKVQPDKDGKVEAKTPARVGLSGLVKMTYENIANEWYLIGLDSVSLRAFPID